MKTELVKQMSPEDIFWYWIRERHSIWECKSAGNRWPWTDDEILQTYSFTNVFRELDKVTVWIRKNWREPYADHPNLWLAMCLARMINWPDTLAEIGFPTKWNPDRVLRVMLKRQERGDKVWTGAYIIRADHDIRNKCRYVIERVFAELYAGRGFIVPIFEKSNSLEESTEALSSFFGWGGFMSYEVVTDLRHTRYLCNARDTHTWANAGPGAQRGLNRINGIPLTHNRSQAILCGEMKELLMRSKRSLPKRFPRLEMRDIEHSLCEFDKYVRVLSGEGRPRSRYQPPEKFFIPTTIR